jgi:hypothetical protein
MPIKHASGLPTSGTPARSKFRSALGLRSCNVSPSYRGPCFLRALRFYGPIRIRRKRLHSFRRLVGLNTRPSLRSASASIITSRKGKGHTGRHRSVFVRDLQHAWQADRDRLVTALPTRARFPPSLKARAASVVIWTTDGPAFSSPYPKNTSSWADTVSFRLHPPVASQQLRRQGQTSRSNFGERAPSRHNTA